MIIGIISTLMFIIGLYLAIFKTKNDNLYWTGYYMTMIGVAGICVFIIANKDIILSWFEI